MKPGSIFEKETRINSLKILGTDLHCSEPPEQVEPVVLVPCLIMGTRTLPQIWNPYPNQTPSCEPDKPKSKTEKVSTTAQILKTVTLTKSNFYF